ncbi:hypothetical protein DPMN_105807 [Dreissena polymorpha]|uniref:Uncharacterized protein n=1 Tax=Dreissena polymorpha TaxID=45954 RepID=A0A9D4QJ49_DREPO|nr:hypothetical protein DPMN_105807 [Dreissena polymorpha]
MDFVCVVNYVNQRLGKVAKVVESWTADSLGSSFGSQQSPLPLFQVEQLSDTGISMCT